MQLRSVESFVEGLDKSKHSCASLAVKAGCSKSMIGHLRQGRYRTNPALAARIERALGVPRGTYFEPVPDEDAA
jgi:transcriptional regulator with XRE-family HTH domain